jgi:Dolichyl-phosphate-mannose-protein mannosyltransferase
VHDNPLAVRIPSVVEFYLAGLLLFAYTGRKLGQAFAAFPVLILWYSPIFQYAAEARPYASLCLWFCALLLLWDLAISGRRSPLVLAGIALSSIGLLASHVLALLTLLAFFSAEVARCWQRRRPDWALWTALFLPLVLAVTYGPFFESYRRISEYPLAFQASFGKLVSFYWHTFISIFWCLAVGVTAAWLAARKRLLWKFPPWQPPEAALFLTLAAVPVLLVLIMMSEKAPFWGRYCITSTVALYFLCALVMASPFRVNERAGYAASAAMGALALLVGVALPLYQRMVHPVPDTVAAFQIMHPELPLVAASGLTFIEMGQYENSAIASRLLYLSDHQAAVQYAHASLFDDLAEFHEAFRLRGSVESYNAFVSEHRDFLVFGTYDYPEDWLLKKLAADGATIRPAGTYATPYKDKSLFAVHFNRSK